LLAPHRKANDRLNVRDLQFNNFRDSRKVTEILESFLGDFDGARNLLRWLVCKQAFGKAFSN